MYHTLCSTLQRTVSYEGNIFHSPYVCKCLTMLKVFTLPEALRLERDLLSLMCNSVKLFACQILLSRDDRIHFNTPDLIDCNVWCVAMQTSYIA